MGKHKAVTNQSQHKDNIDQIIAKASRVIVPLSPIVRATMRIVRFRVHSRFCFRLCIALCPSEAFQGPLLPTADFYAIPPCRP